MGAHGTMVVAGASLGWTEHRTTSSDGTERRNGSDEGGDGKADVDVCRYINIYAPNATKHKRILI